ncbi:MAG: adenylyltransferase/cytidyltransferase family protein [Candidatus Levybacteria bacterium]|nr:adenylyltransferase/cytidyltransferase family protein [Candidatus Levybacteria bacterium]
MKKNLTINEAIEISKNLRKQKKIIIVTGGCFDIIHIGHISLLTEAKKKGDILFVLLENDTNTTINKGLGRPINNQKQRSIVLEALETVDYVINLPNIINDNEYDNLITALRPAIIATTKGDSFRKHKERQALIIGAIVVDVIKPIPNTSTSKMADVIQKKFMI